MKRILFVDDEAPILDGLQDMLRRHRSRWEMSFAVGGEAALAAIAERPFDVVVTDLRMPGIDGAAVLAAVRERSPATARIVLSGQADPEALVRATAVAHQLLAKPCDPEVLRVVIERTCALQELLADEVLRRVIGGIERLPSAPETYLALTRAMADPRRGVGDLAPILEQDPSLVVRVLQFVNSSYFGLSRPVLSIRHAVSLLGMEMVRGVALSAHVYAASGPAVESLQARALRTARLARRMLADDPARAEEAFTAGVVHDVGRLVVALSWPSIFEAVEADVAAGAGRTAAERERLGASHAEIGAYLLGVWGLPFSIIEAVACHHEPARVREGDRAVLAAVHAANVLVSGDGHIDEEFLRSAGRLEQLPGWRKLAADELEGVSP